MDRGTRLRYTISASFMLLLLLAAIFVGEQPKQSSNLCTGVPGGNVVILIDGSVKNNESTHVEIKSRIEKIVNDDSKVKPNDRVSVFLLSDDLTKIKPIFDFCRPLTGGNPLITNPEVQNAFSSYFKNQLAIELTKKSNALQSTPIMEVLSTIGRTNNYNDNRRSLFIFSDLLQNHKNSVNLYKSCTVNGSSLENAQIALSTYRNNSSAYPQLILNRNVYVELHQIPRPERKNIQQSCITTFWQDAFGQATPTFIPLP